MKNSNLNTATLPEVDKEGFKTEDKMQLDQFVQDLQADPSSVAPEFFDLVVGANSIPGTLGKKEDEEKQIRRLASIYLFGEQEFELGSISREPNTRVRTSQGRLIFECQSKRTVVYGVFSHPSLDDILDDARQCAVGAAVAAGIAALATGGAAAYSAFTATFRGCLINKGYGWADQISADIRTRDETGSWRRC